MKPSPNDPRLAIGDAHVHLFNGADLPASGFFEHVLIPRHIPDWPELALAILDIAISVLKAWSITARDELEWISSASLAAPPEPTPRQFADAVADRAERAIALRSPQLAFDPTTNVADSYVALARLLRVERARQRRSPAPPLDQAPDKIATIDRQTLARIADEGAEVLERGSPYESYLIGRSPAELWALVKWAFQMAYSRTAHVRQYLSAMDSKATRPALLVNLLVDYDRWLDDGPKRGSEHRDQVRFWTEYARQKADRLQVETFVGYDPLKHAIERRRSGGSSAYFTDLTKWALAAPDADAKVAGFKLYPPMGFRVWENQELPDIGRAAGIVRKLWTATEKWPIGELAGELDKALDEMFAFATEKDLPLLAHAWPSNEAYEGAGENAHPRYWLKRAENMPPRPGRSPIRACLAHFGLKLDEDGTIKRILDLNLAGGSNIYFDIAFDEEILEEGGADELLRGIEGLCAGREGAADYFLFGTDWIMLAQLPHHERYVDAFDAAIRRSGFWAPRREKLMRGSLRRFLKLDAA